MSAISKKKKISRRNVYTAFTYVQYPRGSDGNLTYFKDFDLPPPMYIIFFSTLINCTVEIHLILRVYSFKSILEYNNILSLPSDSQYWRKRDPYRTSGTTTIFIRPKISKYYIKYINLIFDTFNSRLNLKI